MSKTPALETSLFKDHLSENCSAHIFIQTTSQGHPLQTIPVEGAFFFFFLRTLLFTFSYKCLTNVIHPSPPRPQLLRGLFSVGDVGGGGRFMFSHRSLTMICPLPNPPSPLPNPLISIGGPFLSFFLNCFFYKSPPRQTTPLSRSHLFQDHPFMVLKEVFKEEFHCTHIM